MSLAKIVAQNLHALRLQRKLSQQAIGRKTKLSISYISMLERGERTPPLDTLEVLAKALGVSPLDLLHPAAARHGRTRKR